VIGYSGLTETLLAVARGEVHGGLFQQSALKDFVDKGQLKPPLLIMARERLDLFPDAAPLTELATLSQKQETMFKVYEGMDLAKAFLAPPGVPADRLQFLRETSEKIFADKSFLRQAKLQWPIIAGGYDGAKLAAKVNDIMGSISKKDVAELDQVVSNYLPK
jgi:tripartite-type tricarboxylate transporter receptor subunit TctC